MEGKFAELSRILYLLFKNATLLSLIGVSLLNIFIYYIIDDLFLW